jgi:hypothetical protein
MGVRTSLFVSLCRFNTMPAHKRTKLQRDRELVRVTKLWVLGHSQRDIAAKFGITQQQVCHDLKEVRKRLLPLTADEMNEARSARLLDLAVIKLEYLEEWERSKKDKETQFQEKSTTPVRGNGKGKKGAWEDRTKAALRREGRCANAAYLNGAVKVVQEECRIAGLYAPTKLKHEGGDKPAQLQLVEVVQVVRPSPKPEPEPDPTQDTPPPAPTEPEIHQMGDVQVKVVRPTEKAP